MSWFSVVSIVFLVYNCPLISSLNENYYWREYTGPIPDDAIIGGQDVDGEDIYIGQALVRNCGLVVGEIFPQTGELIAPIYGKQNFTSNVKILCGPKENFYWLPTNAASLHLTLLPDKHAVIGGHEGEWGSYNIGRISLKGGHKIGKINSFHVGNAEMHYCDEDETRISSFEVLIYKNDTEKLNKKIKEKNDTMKKF